MKLYLAIAVLMLAFAALTEAQDAEKTVEERFQDFGTQMTDGFNTFAVKAKETFGDIQSSDVAVKTQKFFDDLFTSIKEKIGEVGQ